MSTMYLMLLKIIYMHNIAIRCQQCIQYYLKIPIFKYQQCTQYCINISIWLFIYPFSNIEVKDSINYVHKIQVVKSLSPATIQSLLYLSWANTWLHNSFSSFPPPKVEIVRLSIVHTISISLGWAVVVVGGRLPSGSVNH